MNKFVIVLTIALGLQAYAAEYLVKYRNQSGISAVHTLSRSRTPLLTVMDTHPQGSLILVNVSEKNKVRAITELLGNPDVEYVVPNFELKSFSTAPIDAQNLREQWAMSKVQAEKAWQRAGNKGKRDIVVAVIDTGVDYKHKALAPNMVPGYDFARNDDDPMDQTSAQNPGHGTHCAGVVGATGLVSGGIIGMSPDVSMMPIRFLDERGSGDLNNGIKAIDFAIEKGAHIISASWGAEVPESTAAPLLEAVKRATDKGIIFVVAAGNSSKSNDKAGFYPANAPYANVINVAASNANDGKPSWSNFGRKNVHVSSPGENIMSTLPSDKYGNLSGTSMATPLVAGLVAFLKAQDPSLTGTQIRALLQTTGTKANIETACNCRVDAFAAVDHLMAKKPWIFPAAATLAANDTLQLNVMNMGRDVTYTSSNPAAVTVDASGVVKAVANGTAKITAQDSAGASASTLDINVGAASSNPGNPGNPGEPGDPSECPLGDPQLCEIACQILPDAPWCQK
ncbi:MAG: S8 family serine peptidase [Bdellovibrionales bacterium]